MRKIVLSPDDFDLFNTDITFSEFEFIHKHWDAFRRMWKEQGRKFWIRFIMTYRKFATEYGAIRDIFNMNEKYTALIDETFIFLHETFIDGKYRDVKNLLEEFLTLAQHKSLIQYLGSKSYAKDPFYNKETRDCFRHLFGKPDEKVSYVKVCVLHDLYTRFGGAVFKCLKRWLSAAEIPPGSEDSWDLMAPPPESRLKGTNIIEICAYCALDMAEVPKRRFSNNTFVTYMLEKKNGQACGPWYVPGWKLHEDPRFHDPRNPLYDLNQDPEEDWRAQLEYNKYTSFIEYVKQYHPVTEPQLKVVDTVCDPGDDPEVMELWKRMYEAGIAESVLNNLATTDQIGLDNLIKVMEIQEDIKREKAEDAADSMSGLDKVKASKGKDTKGKAKVKSTQTAQTANKETGTTSSTVSSTATSTTSTDGKAQPFTYNGKLIPEPVTSAEKEKVMTEAKVNLSEMLGISSAMSISINTHNIDGTKKESFHTFWDAESKDWVGVGTRQIDAIGPGNMNNQDMDMLKDALKDVLGVLTSNDENAKLPDDSEGATGKIKLMGVFPNDSMKQLLQEKATKEEKSKQETSKTANVTNKTTTVTKKTADVTNKAADVTNKAADVTNKAADVISKTADVTNKTADATNKTADVTNKTADATGGAKSKNGGSRQMSGPDSDKPQPKPVSKENGEFDIKTPFGRKMDALFRKAEAGDVFARIKIDRVMLAGEEPSDEEEEDNTNKLGDDGSTGISHKKAAGSKRTLKICANCNTPETVPRTYKKCQKCKELNSSSPRHYCGRDCQVEDWKARHKMEHKDGKIV